MAESIQAKINDSTFEVAIKNDNTATINMVERTYDLITTGTNQWHLLLNHQSFNIVLVRKEGKTIHLKINNRPYAVEVSTQYDALLKQMGFSDIDKSKINELKAPMPGLVLDVLAKNGDVVKKGDLLLILEAMKMENAIKSPADGVVKIVHTEKGVTVDKNQLLISFEQ